MDFSTDYLVALNEFESLENDHKQPYLFAFLGYALYLSQNLEKHLLNVIWAHKVANRTNESSEELSSFFDDWETKKPTMGKLINTVLEILDLTSEDSKKIEALLKKRNFIVHHYFVLNNKLLYATEGYKVIIRDFVQFINSLNELESKLTYFTYSYLEKFGLNKEDVKSEIEKETDLWASLYIDESYCGFDY